jgi:hypothetical protein
MATQGTEALKGFLSMYHNSDSRRRQEGYGRQVQRVLRSVGVLCCHSARQQRNSNLCLCRDDIGRCVLVPSDGRTNSGQ